MNTLLLEIGTEEIPAAYIEPALNELSSYLLKKMGEARIAHDTARTYGTPRRLAIVVENVAARQKSLTIETIGPPEKIGFDESGRATLAAKKFVEKVGATLADIIIKKTDRGGYLCVKKTEKGRSTRTLLKTILPNAILSTAFPKRMRWADLSLSFARPVRWILVLLGDRVVPFVLGNLKSSRYTSGHSFMHPGRIRILHADRYVEPLRRAYVLVDVKERRERVRWEIEKAAEDLGGKVLPDDELVDIVNNLVEYPVPVTGKFDKGFLELPKEILITAMREHQKYFAVTDRRGNLMPHFIAVNNTCVRDRDLAKKGHEKVIRARLKDAQFFYHIDRTVSFDGWIDKLEGVLFQAKLGSMHEKVMRVKRLAAFLAGKVSDDSGLKEQVMRAALLCKADLVSQVVVEFPKLQGIMGRIYAAVSGEPDSVARAIEEHYRPTYSGGPLPETLIGAILSVADKIDSICGCFSIGLSPTGTSDPYALRRQGIGIAQIMLDQGFSFSIRTMIEKSLDLFKEKAVIDRKKTAQAVYTFLKNRIAHLIEQQGFSKDVTAAAISISVDHVPDLWNRVRALERLKSSPDFDRLTIAFKRVVNIIKQARAVETADVDETKFQHASESSLYDVYKKVQQEVKADLESGDFDRALLNIASLREPVDVFFDGVMVMTEDAAIRNNRLSLLKCITSLFERFADFSIISASGSR